MKRNIASKKQKKSNWIMKGAVLITGCILYFSLPEIIEVILYNFGRTAYEQGMFRDAYRANTGANTINDFLGDEEHKKMCDVRVNLALADVAMIRPEEIDETNVDQTLSILNEARCYLIADECAGEATDGHDADAQTLKKEIDAFEEELKKKYKTEETEPEKDSKGAPDVQQGSSEEEQQEQRQREEDDKILNQILQDQNEGTRERFQKQNERNVQDDAFQHMDKNW